MFLFCDMSLKSDAIRCFEEIAAMLELLGEDKFRVNAHARAARSLEGYTGPLEAIAGETAKLREIPGVGPKMADKIVELHTSGVMKEHEELCRQVPRGLFDVMAVPGLGPKTVKAMWESLGVTSIEGLKRVIDDGSILTLPRMGEKAVAKIKASLLFMAGSSERIQLGLALPLAEHLMDYMRQLSGIEVVAFAGSLRRGRDTVGDIDLLVSTSDPAAAGEHFRTAPGVEAVLAGGESKSSVRMALDADAGRWGSEGKRGLQVDLRIVPRESWGAAMMYFTGSKEHNVRLRERALKQGYTLNEYGLYPEDDDPTPPHRRGIRPVAGVSEEEVYRALGLPFIPPEIREDHRELSLTETPDLVEVADIRAELHAHTTESDGHLSLEQLVQAAIDRGFHTIAVTDHSKSSFQARGLDVPRLRAQREAIERARDQFGERITILHGSEVDILADGSLDFDDDTLAWLDVVVASPHASLSQDTATATARLLRAVSHPLVHVLGHPSGRVLGRRKGLEPAMDEVIAAAVEHGTALEINAHWLRLDLRDVQARSAVEAGANIAIDCDVHTLEDFDNLRYGIATARRGWVRPKVCVNTWSTDDLRCWLRRKR
ncbi:MAG: DNA polymerase/3'-5' exonuclease PolX [Leptolyngbya sp. PLA3]|nr:MAG: DNA polymerase/3'-5' exonuclease PolX [Cyanobacteria bacterium CYA]MCE7968317.1 DNA polymerase/3'-5' exonuclease PolX [Leptolyngbya sp. PL-A3]